VASTDQPDCDLTPRPQSEKIANIDRNLTIIGDNGVMRGFIAKILSIGAVFLAFAVFVSPAQAGKSSPQVLALVSIDKPMDLLCFNGDCFVELSAFCLQPDYATPDKGTGYQVAGLGGIRVTGYTKDGQTIALDATKDFKIIALRTHVAVRMSMRAHTMHKMNLARVTVSVAEDTSLIPLPSDKYEAQDDLTIEVATGPWRKIGSQIVDQNPDVMSAARATSRIANGLPPFTHVGPKTTNAIWADVEQSGLLDDMDPAAVRLLTASYQECEEKNKSGGMVTMRSCVSYMHDKFLGDLNMKYWDVIKGAI
jgi:hypothetical protein